MRRMIIMAVAFLLGGGMAAGAKGVDTLYVSHLFTSHVIFSMDVTYVSQSNSRDIGVRKVEENKNMIAIQAKGPFTEACSVSALESNGNMHTFIVVYDEHPLTLIVDLREPLPRQASVAGVNNSVSGAAKPTEQEKEAAIDQLLRRSAGQGGASAQAQAPSREASGNVSTWKTMAAPTLADIIKVKQHLYHIYCTEYDIQALCEDISSYNDVTYFVLSIRNGSGISYEVKDAVFVIENKKTNRRSVKSEETQFPRSRHGKLSAGPGEYSRMAYSFDKMTLAKNQVLKIYIYENNGQRHLLLTVNPEDLNKARASV